MRCEFYCDDCFADYNECEEDVNPCGEGTCVDKYNGHECVCATGTSGSKCDRGKSLARV